MDSSDIFHKWNHTLCHFVTGCFYLCYTVFTLPNIISSLLHFFYPLYSYTTFYLFIHSSLSTRNNAALEIYGKFLCDIYFHFFRYIRRSRAAGSRGYSVSPLRDCQTVFKVAAGILHSGVRVPVCSHPHLYSATVCLL